MALATFSYLVNSMNVQVAKRFFSSVGVKLFLSFWLIAIMSIFITNVVTNQLALESIIVPLHQKDAKRLAYIKNKLISDKQQSIKRVLKRSAERMNAVLFIKHVESGEVYYHHHRYFKPLSKFLEKNDFSNQTTIQFPYFRITGPVTTDVAGQQYQLFIGNKTHHVNFSSVILQLPRWARFIIPVLVSMLLCWLLARYLTKPVTAIKLAAQKIGDGDYKTRVNKDANRADELGQLARSFNLMAQKLENNIHAHQRLMADVSHELRSPLTRLQITLGLMEKAIPKNEKSQSLLARCEREISRLDEMINDVLTLSRQENCIQSLSLQQCNVSDLIIDLCEDASLIANEKQVLIATNIIANVVIHADETLLAGAINNVLTNAIKYSEPGQTVRLSLLVQDKLVVIQVEDEGIGVEPSHLTKLFDPFYRVSDARDRESGGTGLGLAIAKQAIDAHKGKISASNNSLGGLTIEIKLPCL